MDNVAINIDGILYLRIMDPYKVKHDIWVSNPKNSLELNDFT